MTETGMNLSNPYAGPRLAGSVGTPLPGVSVSYTHLRAHETVLDLVCRLLLEKKNTTHIYTSLSMTTH